MIIRNKIDKKKEWKKATKNELKESKDGSDQKEELGEIKKNVVKNF